MKVAAGWLLISLDANARRLRNNTPAALVQWGVVESKLLQVGGGCLAWQDVEARHSFRLDPPVLLFFEFQRCLVTRFIDVLCQSTVAIEFCHMFDECWQVALVEIRRD